MYPQILKMPAYVTLSVSGIGSTATERDVRRYFERMLPGCEPVVSDLVRDPHNGTNVTTVTFKRKSKQACKRAINKLKDEGRLIDAVAFSHTLAFSQSFLDLTLLASKSSDPTFEYAPIPTFPAFLYIYIYQLSVASELIMSCSVYFVHGLGGSAFKTFASKSSDHKKVKMWARDFLPDVLDHSTLGKGRYLTFGYPAPIIDSNRITESIKDTAQNLLRAIMQERGIVRLHISYKTKLTVYRIANDHSFLFVIVWVVLLSLRWVLRIYRTFMFLNIYRPYCFYSAIKSKEQSFGGFRKPFAPRAIA
jgi:hypothetical protein